MAQGPGPCVSQTRARCDINSGGPTVVGLLLCEWTKRRKRRSKPAANLNSSADHLQCRQINGWCPASLSVTQNPTPQPLLLATISRKCLPSMLFLLRVNKFFYSLSGLSGRQGGREKQSRGRCCGDTRERERVGRTEGGREWVSEWVREVKSVLRNVPGQAWGWHSPDDCEGILGRGRPGNPAQHFQPSPSLPPFFLPLFFLPFNCHIRHQVPARLSAMKNIIQPVSLSDGWRLGERRVGAGGWLMSDWCGMETAEPTSPHFCCHWQSAAKSPHVRSTVSSPKILKTLQAAGLNGSSQSWLITRTRGEGGSLLVRLKGETVKGYEIWFLRKNWGLSLLQWATEGTHPWLGVFPLCHQAEFKFASYLNEYFFALWEDLVKQKGPWRNQTRNHLHDG